MKQVHGIDIHPGIGKRGHIRLDGHPQKGTGGRTGRGGKRGVARRGPVRVRPLEKEPEAWTIKIIEDEPELFDYDFDVGAGAGAEQASESPFDYMAAGARFGIEEINCAVCHATFEDREDLLGHLHLSHAMAYSELCDCMVCSGRKLSGLPFHEASL